MKIANVAKLAKSAKSNIKNNKNVAKKAKAAKVKATAAAINFSNAANDLTSLSDSSEDLSSLSSYATPNIDMYDTTFVATSSGNMSTYFLIFDIVMFLIGIIVLMASQSKCQEDPNGSACSSHRGWGIGIIVVTSLLMILTIYIKFFT